MIISSSICILHLQNLRDDYAHQHYSYSSSITVPLHPGMPGNEIQIWVSGWVSTVTEAASFSELAIVSELVPNLTGE